MEQFVGHDSRHNSRHDDLPEFEVPQGSASAGEVPWAAGQVPLLHHPVFHPDRKDARTGHSEARGKEGLARVSRQSSAIHD
jgi:hypothetical protein